MSEREPDDAARDAAGDADGVEGAPTPGERLDEPVTATSIASGLRDLGVAAGDVVLVHASLSAFGWVAGGAPAVVDALQSVVTGTGTVVMPTHSPGNMEPSNMQHPPVPEDWYETIREETPPYRPEVTPAAGMGAVAECFRSYPGVVRSDHPQHSFAAWGADAESVTDDHSLSYSLGEGSPLARVYDLDGDVLFLGTTHATNTTIHLAEYRADLDLGERETGSAVLAERDADAERDAGIERDAGEGRDREWVEYVDLDFDDDDFPECGAAFERERPDAVDATTIGAAGVERLSQRALVDHAVDWLEATRD
jgi:aminoglycoside 3-N-acetyltransferase